MVPGDGSFDWPVSPELVLLQPIRSMLPIRHASMAIRARFNMQAFQTSLPIVLIRLVIMIALYATVLVAVSLTKAKASDKLQFVAESPKSH